MRWLILLYPWLELWTLIELGIATSALGALAWVLLTCVLGISLLRGAGRASVSQLREAQAGGLLRQQLLMDEMSTAFAALLFLIPGLISDFMAVVVLIGPLRRRLMAGLSPASTAGATRPDRDDQPPTSKKPVTLEGDYERLD